MKPIGKPRRGKTATPRRQSAKLYAELLRVAWAGDSRAGCLIVQMLQGARSSRSGLAGLRDLDADGTRLHVAADGGRPRTRPAPWIDVPALRDLTALQPGQTARRLPLSAQLHRGSTNAMLYKVPASGLRPSEDPACLPARAAVLRDARRPTKGRLVASSQGAKPWQRQSPRHFTSPRHRKSRPARMPPSAPPGQIPLSPQPPPICAAPACHDPRDRRAFARFRR